MLEQRIQQIWPNEIWADTRLLVAISGGADSVALLIALNRLAGSPKRIDAAHFNHCWRGAESDADQAFVADLCERLGVKLYTARADEFCPSPLSKTEEAARDARYAFLTEVAYRNGSRYVATGHTASDRIETMLHNLFRGTGLAGVRTPTLTRSLHEELVLVRPLLSSTRADVTEYLGQLGQSYRQDSSNEDLVHRRNFLRKQLLPLLREQYGDQVDQKLLSFSEIADDVHALVQQLAADYIDTVEKRVATARLNGDLKEASQTTFTLPTRRLLPAAWTVVHQSLNDVWLAKGWKLQSMTRGHWDIIRKAWETQNGSNDLTWQTNLPGNIRVWCCVGFLVFEELKA